MVEQLIKFTPPAGLEPTRPDYKAGILPLNYRGKSLIFLNLPMKLTKHILLLRLDHYMNVVHNIPVLYFEHDDSFIAP